MRLLLQGLQRLWLLQSGKGDMDAARKQLLAAAAQMDAMRASAELAADLEGLGFEERINSFMSIPLSPRPLKVWLNRKP